MPLLVALPPVSLPLVSICLRAKGKVLKGKELWFGWTDAQNVRSHVALGFSQLSPFPFFTSSSRTSGEKNVGFLHVLSNGSPHFLSPRFRIKLPNIKETPLSLYESRAHKRLSPTSSTRESLNPSL